MNNATLPSYPEWLATFDIGKYLLQYCPEAVEAISHQSDDEKHCFALNNFNYRLHSFLALTHAAYTLAMAHMENRICNMCVLSGKFVYAVSFIQQVQTILNAKFFSGSFGTIPNRIENGYLFLGSGNSQYVDARGLQDSIGSVAYTDVYCFGLVLSAESMTDDYDSDSRYLRNILRKATEAVNLNLLIDSYSAALCLPVIMASSPENWQFVNAPVNMPAYQTHNKS